MLQKTISSILETNKKIENLNKYKLLKHNNKLK